MGSFNLNTMPASKIKVLSTRTINPGLLREALEHNILIDELSFINTELCDDKNTSVRIAELLKEKINAIFTSMTSIEAVNKHIKEKEIPSWRIYCIGNTTKKLAKDKFSLNNIVATANNSQQLAIEIIKDDPKDVIFFCGNHRRNELPQTLENAGIKVEELVVYKTTGEAHTLTNEYDAILFFSPSAVTSFFSTNTLRSGTIIFAIGATTAETVRDHTTNPLIISDTPGKSDLVHKMIEHFSSKNITCSD